MNFKNLPISDSHTHFFWDLPPINERVERFKRIIKEFNYDSVTVCSIPYDITGTPKCRDFTHNLSLFYLKSQIPGKIYAFTGLTPICTNLN